MFYLDEVDWLTDRSMAQGEHVAKIILGVKCFKTCARKRFSVESCECYQRVLTEPGAPLLTLLEKWLAELLAL
jgi:hypothetical protein